MKYLFVVALLAAATVLSGCAANVRRSLDNQVGLTIPRTSAQKIVMNVTGSDIATSSDDWEPLKGEWRAAMRAATAEVALGYSAQDEAPHPTSEPGTLVVVYINDYRYISPAARYGFGVMTGNAFIDSKVSFLNLQTGAPYGERAYNTSSTAWQGVFSAMTAKQIQAICRDIVSEITSHVGPEQAAQRGAKVDVSPVTPGSAGSHAVLGVRMTALAAKAFGSDGARVAEVVPRSAAAEAGIMQGDILLQVGDRDINDPDDVQTALSAVTPGAIVAIKLMRNARFIWVNVQF
jgi:PDZ domain